MMAAISPSTRAWGERSLQSLHMALTPYRHAKADIEREGSLLAIARAEIDKTDSLKCLLHIGARGVNVVELLDAIATTLAQQIDTPTPGPALHFLHKVLGLFHQETRDDHTNPDRFSDRHSLMCDLEEHFLTCLCNAGIAPALLKLASAKGEEGGQATEIMIRFMQLLYVKEPFAKQLVAEASCAPSLLAATSKAFREDHQYHALNLMEHLLKLKTVGNAFASQLAWAASPLQGGKLPGGHYLMLIWGEMKRSTDVRITAFSCSMLLLGLLGNAWANDLMSTKPITLPLLLRRASHKDDAIRHNAIDVIQRMLALLGAPLAAKLKQTGAFDALLGSLLSSETHAVFGAEVQLIFKMLRASESTPVLHSKLASKVAIAPIINRLGSAAWMDFQAIRVLRSLFKALPDSGLAHQLVKVDGIVARCVDELTRKPYWEKKTAIAVQTDALLSVLFAADETQKVKAFLHYAKHDDNSVVMFNSSIGSPEYPSLQEAFEAYHRSVLVELEKAFHNSPEQPHYQTLVDVAALCGEQGNPKEILAHLGHHLQQFRRRIMQQHQKEYDARPYLQQQRMRRLNRLEKCVNTLSKPTAGQLKQFTQLMPQSMLPPLPAPALMPPGPMPMALTLSDPMLLSHASLTSAVASASSTPLELMPPAPPPLNDYLCRRVLPRNDCAKCTVARGQDASVRENFASEGGRGRTRDISRKRACPIAAHAIALAGDGVPLIEEYERAYNEKVGGRTTKRQKFQQFMRDQFGVEPLGDPKSYKVTLYTPPRIDASLALDGGSVKLSLTAFGYEPTSTQGTKDNYMGFQIA